MYRSLICNKKLRKICCPNPELSRISKVEETTLLYDYNSKPKVVDIPATDNKDTSRQNTEIKCGTLLGSAQHALSGSGRSYFAPWAVSVGKYIFIQNLLFKV